MVRLLVRNLSRNRRRTLLTISSVAVSLFLVATLRTILTELHNPPETPDSALRLITRHRVSLFNSLPRAHHDRIARVEGVEALMGSFWFGGIYKDPANFFANFAADPAELFEVHPDMRIDSRHREAFVADRTGCVVGDRLARRFGWRHGDTVPLTGSLWPVDVELTIRGIYAEGPDQGSSLYFHWEYFNELLKARWGEWDNVGAFTIRVRSPELVGPVADAIDTLFANSAFPTRTESEKAFILGFVSMLGDVQTFITGIVAVVVFAIVLVAANTMAMSIRERAREIGVLKAIGFRRGQVLRLLVGESLTLSVAGALIGSVGARLVFSRADMSAISGGFLQRFLVTGETLSVCVGIGVLVGLIAAGLPAWQAARRPVVDALRRPV